MEREKPPLGVMSEKYWKEDRLKALEIAIAKRCGTAWNIPLDWVIERNRLLNELEGLRVI